MRDLLVCLRAPLLEHLIAQPGTNTLAEPVTKTLLKEYKQHVFHLSEVRVLATNLMQQILYDDNTHITSAKPNQIVSSRMNQD